MNRGHECVQAELQDEMRTEPKHRMRYTYDPALLHAGASLGTPAAFAYLDPLSNPRGVWSAEDNQFYSGPWELTFTTGGHSFQPRQTTMESCFQKTEFTAGAVRVGKTFFLPYDVEAASANDGTDRMRMAVMMVDVENGEKEEILLDAVLRMVFPAVPCDMFLKQPPEDQTTKTVACREVDGILIATTVGNESETRVVNCSLPWQSCETDERQARLSFRLRLAPGDLSGFSIALAWSSSGNVNLLRTLGAESMRSRFEQAVKAFEEVCSRCDVQTPDSLLNRGIYWAKVNMLRVQHLYRTGAGFTNDPPQDIVVIRDLAWYVFGSDFLTPWFSRALLENAIALAVHAGGKLTEYYRADETHPEQHDYALNINDDTPLFILALWHHYAVHQDHRMLEQSYPAMRAATDWILSQRKDGLVVCNATGTSVWGICGWRNIIDGYTLTGAVTEINAECVAAIHATANAAALLGRNAEAEEYMMIASDLRNRINARLVSPETGLYLLNIDHQGVPHHDRTGDQIFPVLFGVADASRREKILELLTGKEFLTAWGIRTVAPGEPMYDPVPAYQLVGGVWPNLTGWVAMTLRKEQPDLFVDLMRRVFTLSEPANPSAHGYVVPGEFPERLHGTLPLSCGMTMSPWMPPTYLWMAVEGLLGLVPGKDGLALDPHLPQGWRWIALRNMPLAENALSLFIHEGTAYANMPLKAICPVLVGEALRVEVDTDALVVHAFQLSDGCVVCAGSAEGADGVATVSLDGGELQVPIRLGRGESVVLRSTGKDGLR